MVLTIEISVSLFRISHHLIGPFEEGFVLNLFQDLMHEFSEYSSNHQIVIWPLLLGIIPSRPVIVVSVRPKISHFLRDKLSFPFPYCWSTSILLHLSTLSISCRKLVTGLPVRDFLKPCSEGRPTLKVLIASSSKLPSISLNISQYLSAYDFTDSPSLIVIDSRESKGWGTLLHVINQEQNDWVSFLKELMELVLNPSNHLIGIGPKLEGNTLHSKVSSWE